MFCKNISGQINMLRSKVDNWENGRKVEETKNWEETKKEIILGEMLQLLLKEIGRCCR